MFNSYNFTFPCHYKNHTFSHKNICVICINEKLKIDKMNKNISVYTYYPLLNIFNFFKESQN